MRGSHLSGLLFFLLCLLLSDQHACAQTVIHDKELLASDRPEAWAMNYVVASSFMTAFGASPTLAPGRWSGALELGHIPRLDAAQQRVGFRGSKLEDLNKSPVFGRLRLMLGLPAGWVAELGYTPPLAIDGTRAHDLVALAIGRRVFERDGLSLSVRAFGQHGSATGDITCAADLAGVRDFERNPFGCQAASHDRIALTYYGVDTTAGWNVGAWRWHAGVGVARTEPVVQVDALTFAVRDRSLLVARGVLPYLGVGASRALMNTRWSVGVEVLYVPLDVRRDQDVAPDNDPLTSLRLQLRYRGD